MSFSYATVIETIQLTPRLRRITLQVDDPELLEVKPGGDSAVGVYFPSSAPTANAPSRDRDRADGGRYVDPESGSEGRNYTVRGHDGDRIDLGVTSSCQSLAGSGRTTTGVIEPTGRLAGGACPRGSRPRRLAG